jgi:hypothetical protein
MSRLRTAVAVQPAVCPAGAASDCVTRGRSPRRGSQGWSGSARGLACFDKCDSDRTSPAYRPRRCLLVEGPLDVLALQQWGVPGLALCGTGFSPTTLQLLRQWKRLYAMLDADSAGHEATASHRHVRVRSDPRATAIRGERPCRPRSVTQRAMPYSATQSAKPSLVSRADRPCPDGTSSDDWTLRGQQKRTGQGLQAGAQSSVSVYTSRRRGPRSLDRNHGE